MSITMQATAESLIGRIFKRGHASYLVPHQDCAGRSMLHVRQVDARRRMVEMSVADVADCVALGKRRSADYS